MIRRAIWIVWLIWLYWKALTGQWSDIAWSFGSMAFVLLIYAIVRWSPLPGVKADRS